MPNSRGIELSIEDEVATPWSAEVYDVDEDEDIRIEIFNAEACSECVLYGNPKSMREFAIAILEAAQ